MRKVGDEFRWGLTVEFKVPVGLPDGDVGR